MAEKVFMSWGWVDHQIEVIANSIEDKNKFVAVTGVPRGGLIPAVMLSHKLGLKYIPYTYAVKKRKPILVVDDIADSGFTLTEVGTKGFKTATLCIRYSTQYTPDYYGEEITDDRWIVFPWEDNDSKAIQGYLYN
tara:strand:+ start:188 stop:592 length:405 start_codon:yes stop_codon:yes gene_type:complete